MFNVIRIPTKYSRTIKRFSEKEKAELLDSLISIGAGMSHKVSDSLVWDTISLIYWDWMNMEKKNGVKIDKSLIIYPSELPAQVTASESVPIVQYSEVKESIVKDNKDIIINNTEQSSEVSTEVIKYWNEEINNTLEFLCKAVWIDEFKESKQWQRNYWKHFVGYKNKIWWEDFLFRLKWVLSDDFKQKNCNSIKYLYNEMKAYIHSPVVEKDLSVKNSIWVIQ